MSDMIIKDLVLSVVMPARNEVENLTATIPKIVETLDREKILFEIVVVDDHSTDLTREELAAMAGKDNRIRCVANDYPS
jgi:glycosyltransferase involved in cell wall biosynthesis